MSVLDAMGRMVPVSDDGLVLREWSLADMTRMVQLFDTREVDRWTPLPSPFDEQVATDYIRAAHVLRRKQGTLQLAICPLGGALVGEVIAFGAQQDRVIELAYALGPSSTGHGFARRAVELIVGAAARSGGTAARLQIDADNVPSQRVAAASGFRRTAAALSERRRKGYVLHLEEWQRSLNPEAVGTSSCN